MLDELRANIRRAALALIIGFVVVAGALGYWQVWRTDLAHDAANPRVAQERLEEPRGRIVDRTGQVLAASSSTAHSRSSAIVSGDRHTSAYPAGAPKRSSASPNARATAMCSSTSARYLRGSA